MAHEHGPFLEYPSQSPPNDVWREIAHVVLAEGNKAGFSPGQCERDSKQGYGTRVLVVRFGIYGSVAILQVARDRLAGCSSWPLRFAVYSSGGNLSRRSSCWQWGGTCAFSFRTATSRSCSPSGACAPITSQSGGGSSATPRN